MLGNDTHCRSPAPRRRASSCIFWPTSELHTFHFHGVYFATFRKTSVNKEVEIYKEE